MIDLIRIDDRLVHGQVMAVWVRGLSIRHIFVADDETAGDSFSRQVMQLAMPKGVMLTVATVEDAGRQLASMPADGVHRLVLLRSVDAAVRLHRAFPFTSLNVGGIGMMPGRKLLWRSIAMSPDEVAALRSLRQQGVDVYLQMIPTDPRKRLEELVTGNW